MVIRGTGEWGGTIKRQKSKMYKLLDIEISFVVLVHGLPGWFSGKESIEAEERKGKWDGEIALIKASGPSFFV